MAHSKRSRHAIDLKKTKHPREEKNAQSYYGFNVSFSFRKYDAGAPWATAADGKPAVDGIFKMLRGVESAAWGDIRQASGGRSLGTNSHPISIKELSKDAQDRADEIALSEDVLFSMRLTGTVRLWGVIEPSDGRFFVIWYDPEHKVCPVGK